MDKVEKPEKKVNKKTNEKKVNKKTNKNKVYSDGPRIPRTACYDIMRNKTRLRIGDTASSTMSVILEELCENIATEAAYLAKHAGRKTIKKVDVISAYERVKSRS